MSLRPKQVNFTTVWDGLLDTVKSVITCYTIVKSTWNDRFTDVYTLCVAHPEPLADKLYFETKKYLEQHVFLLFQEVSACGEENLLEMYHRHWTVYSQGAQYLNQLYGYLNSQVIKKTKCTEADINYGTIIVDSSHDMIEIGELGLDIWKRIMIEPLKDSLVSLLQKQIKLDRCNGTVNQPVVHGVICSLVEVEANKTKSPLQLYEELFEASFLQETREYYKQEADRLKTECTCSQYMQRVAQKLDTENLRSRKFLNPSSYSKVTTECQQKLVADHMQFLHSECEDMVRQEIHCDLSNMYTLLKPICGGLDALACNVESHIKQIALSAVVLKGDNLPAQFVESLLTVHQKFTQLIHAVFQSDQQFIGALDRAMSVAINHKPSGKTMCRSPELLAKYCDNLLKKNMKGLSETEQDEKLARSITIFKYLDDKDIYQRVYSRMLAKRLIYSLSASMDSEEAMINRLKQACGYEFTNKLHRMFTDMSISSDLQNKFTSFAKDLNVDVNFSVLVLQAGAWPLSQNCLPEFSIPQELEKSVQTFETFYNHSFNGRKLTWMYNYSNAELKLNYLQRPYFVTVGTYHMAILLMFNKRDSLTLSEIQQSTQLDNAELVKQIQSLVESRIITTNDTVTTKSSIQLNMKFTNKRTKFKITSSSQKESTQEVESTQVLIDDDRKMYLQAAIVRIMKARKVLKHTMLINEVISQLRNRFAPSISLIKKCIEILIDKQYLERTPNCADEYSYIA